MNPDTSNPSFELPVPQPQNTESAPAMERVAPRPETNTAPAPSQPVPTTPVPIQSPMPTPVPVVPAAVNPGSSNTPVVAEDNDLIEKEWVVKAKQIVAATKEDPHTQNKEINRFKADYLKKRYNKDIKLEGS